MNLKKYKNIIFVILALLVINILVSKFNIKWDLTEDRRFTLSETTKKLIKSIDKPTQVLVFLDGDFPAYFKRLRNETKNILHDYHDLNSKIDFVFIDPLKQDNDYIKGLTKKGLQASQITVKKSGKLEQVLIFPWAIVKQGKKEVPISLLTQAFTKDTGEQIQKSIESLEYNFDNAFDIINAKKDKKIAILKGNGELDDLHLTDFLRSLGKKYRLAPFTLDSVSKYPQKTLKELQFFDLAIVAKPTKKFTEEQKYTLDQFLMNGGKLLMAIDAVKAHKDTLMYHGKTYALNAELNSTDFLFNYGVRINPQLVKDIVAAPVVLKVGQVGNKPQFDKFPWFYSPLAHPEQDNPIGKNLDLVKLDFASPMDTLKNKVKKIILLKSSPKTDLVGVPTEINFSEIGKKPKLQQFNKGEQIFGVLLEGKMTSAYAGRVQPIKIKRPVNQRETAMIVLSDGDVLKNDLNKGKPLELGFDKWSKIKYDNKAFMLNAVDYLMDNSGIINLKNKEVKLKFLDENKVLANLSMLQIINTLLPLFLIGIFAFGFNYFRKKKYAK